MGFLSRFKSKKIDFISVSKPQAEPLKIVFKVDGKHIKEYEFFDVPFEVRKALMDKWDNEGLDACIAYFKSDIQGKYQCKKLSERN